MQPSQEALQRLAGASKRRKLEEEGFNQIIDVNFDDIKPDEREWITKALTEDDADKPGPKVLLFCVWIFYSVSFLFTLVSSQESEIFGRPRQGFLYVIYKYVYM